MINSSVAGVICEAGKHECIEEIYGGLNGVYGILREELVDIGEENTSDIQRLKHTPAAALGTCRYKIDFKTDPKQAEADMKRLFEVIEAHNIRYFFYAGGNDSQDTTNKVHLEAQKRGYDLRAIGVPKTIDNDLPHTDHTPGYGSVIKYNATTVMEVGADVRSMATDDGSCCIIEVMGRAAGWIAAGTVLAKREPEDPPHIILLPEIAFEEEEVHCEGESNRRANTAAAWSSSAKGSRTPKATRSARTKKSSIPSAIPCSPVPPIAWRKSLSPR